MKFLPKHRRVIEKQIAEGKQYVTLDGEVWSVDKAAHQMGIKIKKQDKYRKEHADLGQPEPRRDIEDSGDGVSESEE
jgi:hypothetical protein